MEELMVKKFFQKKEKESKDNNAEFLSEFQTTLEKKIREEKTQVLMTKKLQSKLKEMVKILLNNGFSIDEINLFVNSNKKFIIKDGEIIDDLS